MTDEQMIRDMLDTHVPDGTGEWTVAIEALDRLVAEAEKELKTANFFRDKLAERLYLVESAAVELEGALGCDEAVDPAHWRDHAQHSMESALNLCKRATKARAALHPDGAA